MHIVNPVLENENPNCRCKDCFHSFWLKTLPDSNLKCYCQLSHSITFSDQSDNISICSGAEDNINFSDFFKQKIACTHCNHSLWFRTQKSNLRCFCLHLQSSVFDSLNKKILPVTQCNGVLPVQEISNFPQPTNLDDF